MRDVLRSSLGRSLRDLSVADRLQAAWPVACGSAMASHGVVAELEDGRLHVVVDSREWLDTFRSMRSALAHDLGRIAGVPVREIHFELTAASGERTRTARRNGPHVRAKTRARSTDESTEHS